MELAGKVAIITGGASGIGRGSVELFVEEGAKVVIADINEREGRELAHTLGSSARFRRTDVSDRDDVQALVDFAVSEFGGLHIMFNNAGLPDESTCPLLDADFSRFERVMQVNVLGVMLGTQIAARHMVKHGGGSIINTSSTGGLRAGHSFTMYRAAKAGVINFTQNAAIELGPYLIRVNCICPGNIPTDMASFAAAEPGMSEAHSREMQREIRAVRMDWQPLKRQGAPRDIGQTALFLGSDRSQQMTGQTLTVDGGAATGDCHSLIKQILDVRSAYKARGKV